MRRLIHILGLLVLSGCGILPTITHKPVIRNPFPQLSRVAIAPFFNLSDEPTVDGREFAKAYFNELQVIPGFEVVPLSVVEQTIRQNRLTFSNQGEDARRLAQLLGVDAVVIGAITEFSPYYPPRCGLHVEWWAANPCFHPIPAGYGLPWGTTEEEFIPDPLVYEAEFALARAQLATQTPKFDLLDETPLEALTLPGEPELLPLPDETPRKGHDSSALNSRDDRIIRPNITTGFVDSIGQGDKNLPENWPDERGFFPPAPQTKCPTCEPNEQAVLRHTRVYHGNDADFTESLANYEYFRDDARYGGWQGYMLRSKDFIRFCCHLHLSEMLSSRGGAAETQVVWRWSDDR